MRLAPLPCRPFDTEKETELLHYESIPPLFRCFISHPTSDPFCQVAGTNKCMIGIWKPDKSSERTLAVPVKYLPSNLDPFQLSLYPKQMRPRPYLTVRSHQVIQTSPKPMGR